MRQAEDELGTLPHAQFSPQALGRLRESLKTYVVELIDESFNVARRNRSPDAISEDHVAQATKHLVSRGIRPLSRLVGLLAGAFLGAAFSGLVSMAIAGTYPAAGVVVTVAFAIIGAFISGHYFTKE